MGIFLRRCPWLAPVAAAAATCVALAACGSSGGSQPISVNPSASAAVSNVGAAVTDFASSDEGKKVATQAGSCAPDGYFAALTRTGQYEKQAAPTHITVAAAHWAAKGANRQNVLYPCWKKTFNLTEAQRSAWASCVEDAAGKSGVWKHITPAALIKAVGDFLKGPAINCYATATGAGQTPSPGASTVSGAPSPHASTSAAALGARGAYRLAA
jgi:hypothetical protein